jgi:hypothetical protein
VKRLLIVTVGCSKIFERKSITRNCFLNRNTVDGDKRYCCTFLLDPNDPLFVDIGKAFILQQIKGSHYFPSYLISCGICSICITNLCAPKFPSAVEGITVDAIVYYPAFSPVMSSACTRL